MMRLDIDRVVREARAGQMVRGARYWSHLMVPSTMAVVGYRWAHALHRRGWRRLAAVTTLLNQRVSGVFIHPASRIGQRLFIPHTTGVTFYGSAGDDLTLYPACHIGPRVFLHLTADLHDDCPRLGNNVRIGALAVVMGGVVIGDQATVTVRAVVDKDVAAGTVAQLRPRWRIHRPDRIRHDQGRETPAIPRAELDTIGASAGQGNQPE